jgi:hypothetical protein
MKKTFLLLMFYLFSFFDQANAITYRNYNSDITSTTLFDSETDYPTVQASHLNFYFIQPGQISIGWWSGDGSARLVFVKKGDTGIADPIDGTSYIPNSQFGQGSQIDASGWFCVHKSLDDAYNSNRDTITGLEPNTVYRFTVIEYNGNAGDEKYLLSFSDNNLMNQTTKPGVAGFIETVYFSQPLATSFSYSRNIIDDGGTPIVSHGICWAIHPLPTMADSVHVDGSDIGAFNTTISPLKPNMTYYLCTFLVYTDDTIFSNVVTLKTISVKSSMNFAYDMLIPPLYGWGKDPNNWVFGSIAGGDANKGSDIADQPDIIVIQEYQATPYNSYTIDKWNAMYEAVARCNDAIVAVNDSLSLDPNVKESKLAELLFLRAFYYFELIKVFGPMLPWIDETNMLQNTPVPNDFPIWSYVENDFQNSIDGLPDISDWAGHVNIWAAKAFYAKLLLYEKKFIEAKVLFDDVIANGKTTSGDKYALLNHFDDNFNIQYNNSSESVFAQQALLDGQNNMKANPGYSITYPWGGILGGCCGLFQPSQSLVNSFKVDKNGLPFFDPSHNIFPFNSSDLHNDDGIYSDQFFIPDTLTPIDPRLDWTVGRRGIPYLDWGINPGYDWIRDQQYGGPYIPMKHIYRKADYMAGRTGYVGGWAPGSELNYNLMRFADVLLMAAECEIEINNLNAALSYINQVRIRAGNSHVKIEDRDAANYQIGIYPLFPDQQYAREAVRFERKLELAMEGHRFFDLVRWGDYYASVELNTGYLSHESTHRTQFYGVSFDTCQLYFTIPQVIDIELPKIKKLGDSPFRLYSYNLSGLPINFSVSDSNVIKMKGDTLYIIGLGTATVTASQSVKPGCLPASTDTKTITIIPDDDLSRVTIEEGKMQLYPNPTTGLVTIWLPELNEKSVLSVIDISGRTVYQQKLYVHHTEMINLDLSFLEPAIYIIIIRNKNQIIRNRIIIE